MKSNIGLVFVVNSEKAFGRFVKEFAGEEEMTSCSLGKENTSLTLSFQPTADSIVRVLKSVGEANS